VHRRRGSETGHAEIEPAVPRPALLRNLTPVSLPGVEEQNVIIEYRSPDGRGERLPDLASELVTCLWSSPQDSS
jgi:hypothetical protein